MVNDIFNTGLTQLDLLTVIMFVIGLVLIVLAIIKKWEPYELLPLGVGIVLTNFPLTAMFVDAVEGFGQPGILFVLYNYGILWTLLPVLIFIGLGAMVDFGPLLADPKLIVLGFAAQVGIFFAFVGSILLGFTTGQAASIAIIGGADGPTTIFLTSRLAPEILGVCAVAAYTYIGMIPFINPPVSKLLTSKKERLIRMKPNRTVHRYERILFPIITSFVVILLIPQAGTIVGCFMFGNLIRESGVVPRLSKAAQNELTNLVTMFLCFAVGASLNSGVIMDLGPIRVLGVFALGIFSVGAGAAVGVLIAKFMNLFLKNKINPLIGAAGVSAVPAAARTAQAMAMEEDPNNHILMYAMAPNVAGVIGSAAVAGVFLGMLF
ncbi:MAG: sodium ion-translocating decarboxylase subunit beta [Candidatus Thermoplasmatota archaeon]|nr:sodium ion-translocating decarboxylase subunit beta [Candidatus Thermoplasmatota archaeon]